MVTASLTPAIGPRAHPAERRRVAARMPHRHDHDVALRPLGGGDGKAVIVTSAAQDPVAELFENLQASDWPERLATLRRRRFGPADGVLELSPPIHRRVQIALFEARCERPGRPRLDPARIAGSGLMVRRVAGAERLGWMRRGRSIDGWQQIARPGDDPDPARAAANNPTIAALAQAVAARRGRPSVAAVEAVNGLHVAPPEVNAAVGATVLFAVIPVASSEAADDPGAGVDYAALDGQDRADVLKHLSEYLTARPFREMPHAGEWLDPKWNALAPAMLKDDPRLASVATFLLQATAELGCLGEGPAARALMAVLAEVQLPMADAGGGTAAPIDAAEFIRRAAPILVYGDDNPAGFHMPLSWPEVRDDLSGRIVTAALACLSEQQAGCSGSGEMFADPDALYIVNGFIRVAGEDGCPDRMVWSTHESEPFRVLPWWDGDGAATTISLPDLKSLKKLKPSVAFAMPPAIGNLLKGDMSDLKDGKGADDESGLAWICSFSLPYITICAFIVLNIFLSLFDLIFSWMAFIKVCIPVPKSAMPSSKGGG